MLSNLKFFYNDDAQYSFNPEHARLDHNLEPIPVVTSVPTPSPPRLEHPVFLPEKSEDAHLFPKYMYSKSKTGTNAAGSNNSEHFFLQV